MSWTAETISELYKARWRIEIFFREIKQLLMIKTFIGTSENAVMIQIWTAMITIMMLRVMKKMAKYGWHMSNLAAFLRLNIFVKINLQKWLDLPYQEAIPPSKKDLQGVLF
jgi:IS4 transposase